MSDEFDNDIPLDDNLLKNKNSEINKNYDIQYLKSLNKDQLEAVKFTEGPILVLAGAGTGKTNVLVTRIGHIINMKLAKPWEILAVTFTNKASREMSDRLNKLVNEHVEGMWLGTFHSIGAKILRKNSELIGLKNNFSIIDTDDQIRVLKQIMKVENIDEKRWPARILASIINTWKDKGITPEHASKEDSGEFAIGKSASLYKEYSQRLKLQNAADFGDLLIHCLEIFKNHSEVLEEYQRRFKYILVDEYQDTNAAQYLWLKILAQGNKNICCVGDDDQSIYGWRGADVNNILRFENDFLGAKIIRLEQNYRSQPHILAAASHLIQFNSDRLGKTLWTEKKSGEKILVCNFYDGEEEARYIAGKCENLYKIHYNLNEIAILVRAGFQTREFEDCLLELGIPYRVIGGPRFYERKEIRDAIAYLRVVSQSNDGIAFERIVNVPKRGLGNATMQAVHIVSRNKNLSLISASQELILSDELRPQAKKSLSNLIESFSRWRSLAETKTLGELLEIIMEESGYIKMLQNDKSIEGPGRIDNLKELITTIENYETLTAFLDHVSLVMENEKNLNSDMINIMTLHAAKGLEFEKVFLPGWEEGIIPNQRSLDEKGKTALEEERRLAHVGLTRAKTNVQISFAHSRKSYGEWQSSIPSRFIDELPTENIEMNNKKEFWNQAQKSSDEFNQDSGIEEFSQLPYKSNIFRKKLRSKKLHNLKQNIIETESIDYIELESRSEFKIGDRVFHKKFGYGHVNDISNDRLEIFFDKAGEKKVLDSFVQLANKK